MKLLPFITLSILIVQQIPAEVITTLDQDGYLEIVTTDSDDVILTLEQGFLRVNGEAPTPGEISFFNVTGYSITGDDGPNQIDISGIGSFSNSFKNRSKIITNGGDDIVVSNLPNSIVYSNGLFIDLGNGKNTLNFDQSNLHFIYQNSSFTAEDTITGSRKISGLWIHNNRGNSNNSTFEISEDADFIRIEYSDGTNEYVTKLRNLNTAVFRCSDGDQVFNVSEIQIEAIKAISYQLGQGNDVVNTFFLPEIDQDIIGEVDGADTQSLAIDPGTLFVEQDFEFMVLLANTRYGDITYKDIDETTFNGEPVNVDHDAWQIR